MQIRQISERMAEKRICDGRKIQEQRGTPAMRCIIVNSSDIFEYRVKLLRAVLRELGYEVTVIASDYRHIEKVKRQTEDPDFRLLPTLPYAKNISVRRILSHLDFAHKALCSIRQEDCDLLYLIVPPNAQAGIASAYKKKHPETRVIMDVIDLWPESLPIAGTDRFPFTVWSGIRNRNLKYADTIITECRLYHQYIRRFAAESRLRTVYWCHGPESADRKPAGEMYSPDPGKWVLGYLGSINNIIDIDGIAAAVSFFAKDKPVAVRIVGGGEKEEAFAEACRCAGAEVIRYGKIYDPAKKQEIFSACHYGINIMKKTVTVGLSMKSVDYMEMGLPILNGLSGDTYDFVKEEKIGRNLDALDYAYDEKMRANARAFYEKHCSFEAYKKAMKQILTEQQDFEEVSG